MGGNACVGGGVPSARADPATVRHASHTEITPRRPELPIVQWTRASGVPAEERLRADDAARIRGAVVAARLGVQADQKRSRRNTAWKVHVTPDPRSSCFTHAGTTGDSGSCRPARLRAVLPSAGMKKHQLVALLLMTACGGTSETRGTPDASAGTGGFAGGAGVGGSASGGVAGAPDSGSAGSAGGGGVAGGSPDSGTATGGSAATAGKTWKPDPKITGDNSCAGRCGSSGPPGCRCDAACVSEGGCCVDYSTWCTARVPAPVGACVKNGNDACQVDADCSVGGCALNLCHNPGLSPGNADCFCTPDKVTCGCVEGGCNWY